VNSCSLKECRGDQKNNIPSVRLYNNGIGCCDSHRLVGDPKKVTLKKGKGTITLTHVDIV
jgi:hypothetical protein